MKVCVYLSYIGLGANLLHLSYVHQLSEKFGPITVFSLCKNLSDALEAVSYTHLTLPTIVGV